VLELQLTLLPPFTSLYILYPRQKVLKNPTGERSEPEGSPPAAEWRSVGESLWRKWSRGGVSRLIFRFKGGDLLGFQESFARMEALVNNSSVLAVVTGRITVSMKTQ
jgi:hypothetical protein